MHHEYTPAHIARFLCLVSPDPKPHACWAWKGKTNPKGYGLFQMRQGWERQAHRLAYVIFVGPIPDDLWVLHHCDNPPCVRPDHLWLGTNEDNVRDRELKKRAALARVAGRPKISEVEAGEIRRLAANGWAIRWLARRYGIREVTVRDILRGKTWKQVA